MSDICERTGLSRGGLYRHYSSTAEIFRELITDHYSFDERINNRESALLILESTLTAVENEILHKENSLSLAIYEFANTGDNRHVFADIENRAKNRWTRLIEYGISTGEYAEVNAEAVAEMILYYYQGLRMWSKVVDIDSNYAMNYRNNIISVLTGKCPERK
ncbi:MAG: TetR/AcrR family transcriptional regulator [Clostridia bacterium]|nr:TetR/AcrR family transcriptional regulator [Clostridia bacterium]